MAEGILTRNAQMGTLILFLFQYFLYKFPHNVDSVIIKVVSETVYPCSVVSVQDIVVSLEKVLSACNGRGLGVWVLGIGILPQSLCVMHFNPVKL